MNRCVLGVRLLQSPLRVTQSGIRTVHTTDRCDKNIRAGKKKISVGKRVIWLSYEEAQPPEKIGVTKSWHSWNTSNLEGEERFTPQVTVEDMLIRRFIKGTWPDMFASDVIIKRRHNQIFISGIINMRRQKLQAIYFLVGYTEEILGHLLHRPIKLEIQTIRNNVGLQNFKVI